MSTLNIKIPARSIRLWLSFESGNHVKDLESSTLFVWRRQPSMVVVFNLRRFT